MAKTMQVDLVSPEQSLASLEATSVRLPGSEGHLTAMPGHWPMLTTLKPGMVVVESESGTLEFAVTGGFVDISATSATVLAERAFPKGPEAVAALEAELEKARAAVEAAHGAEKDIAVTLVHDFVHLLEHMQ